MKENGAEGERPSYASKVSAGRSHDSVYHGSVQNKNRFDVFNRVPGNY